MIVIDRKRYVKKILKEGLEANDYYAKKKLYAVAYYLINCTQYRSKQRVKIMKKISKKYYEGMNDEFINSEINFILDDIKKLDDTKKNEDINYDIPTICIYQDELDKISELQLEGTKESKAQNEKLQVLAFTYIVYAKVETERSKQNRKMWFKARSNELFQLAGIDKSVSGVVKNKMMKTLVDKGIIQVVTFFKYGATLMFSVPIVKKKNDSKAVLEISNYTNIPAYYRYYKNDPNIKLCEDCQIPIEITSNRIKYCTDCALKKNR